VSAASAAGVTVVLLPRVGEHLVAEQPLASVWPGPVDPAMRAAILDAVLIGPERTLQQDIGFGMRQLVDIALKALSPAVNDPYTGVMVIDRLTTLLCALTTHPLGDVLLRDAEGKLRVAAPVPPFDDYLNLCCDQIRRYGASEPQVLRALLRMLRKVADFTDDPDRRAALARHARLVLEAGEQSIVLPEDKEGVRRAYGRLTQI